MNCNNTLIDIETTLAHHEQQIEQMNAVITDQWKQIEMLEHKLSRAVNKIEQLGHTSDGEEGLSSLEQAARDKPPHY